jgi:hypothetical protein
MARYGPLEADPQVAMELTTEGPESQPNAIDRMAVTTMPRTAAALKEYQAVLEWQPRVTTPPGARQNAPVIADCAAIAYGQQYQPLPPHAPVSPLPTARLAARIAIPAYRWHLERLRRLWRKWPLLVILVSE